MVDVNKIDWKKEALDVKEDLMKDLQALLRIESVKADPEENAPLGFGTKEALLKMESIAKRDNFKTDVIDNLVGYAEYGNGEDYIGVLGHLDVMPGGDGWTTEPFTPVIKDNKIYARGSSDDKGPLIAAYYGLKIIQKLNLPIKNRIRVIFGTDEENNWIDMDAYFKKEKQPLAGFSPDAEFPIINGEKGLGSYQLKFDATNSDDDDKVILKEFKSGSRTNMVPGKANATISNFSDANELINLFNQFIDSHDGVSGSTEVIENNLTFTFLGKQVHGALPETGINSATYLANFLNDLSFGGTAKNFINFLGTTNFRNSDGNKIGLKTHDDLMGDLSFNLGIANFDPENKDGLVDINIRYPQNITDEKIINTLNDNYDVKEMDSKFIGSSHNMPPHYVSPDSKIVKTLLGIYSEQSGLPSYDQVIGGGTYARTLKNGVAYGALFPGDEDTMHQADEYMDIDRIIQSTAIYAQAIYELGNF